MVILAGLQLFSVLFVGGIGVIWIITNLIMAWNPGLKRTTRNIILNHALGSALIAVAWVLALLYGWISLG